MNEEQNTVIICMDNILVVNDWESREHFATIKEVINIPKNYLIEVNDQDCEWIKNQVDYLGVLFNRN